MEPRLLPVNGFVALALPSSDARVRPLLREQGFRLAALELPLNVPVGPSAGTVVADAVAWNDQSGTLLVAEAKSGRNVDLTQAGKYSHLAAEVVLRATKVDITRDVEPRVVIAYCVLAQDLDRIRAQLRTVLPSAVILSFDQSDDSTDIGLDDPHGFLGGHTRVAWPTTIPPLIRLDHESPLPRYLPQVRSALVAAQSRGEQILTVTALAEQVVPYFAFFTNGPQSRIVSKVEAAAREVALDKPDDYRLRTRSGTNKTPAVEILRTPESHDRRGRTQAYQALARPRRRRGTPADPNQLDLLAELEIDSVDADGQTEHPRPDGEGVPNE